EFGRVGSTADPSCPPDEATLLRQLTINSKAYCGYDLGYIERWIANGDFSPTGLADKNAFVAEADGEAVGWAALIARDDLCWLDDMWVEPEWIGRGIGTLLFRHALKLTVALGAQRLEWQAETNAVSF